MAFNELLNKYQINTEQAKGAQDYVFNHTMIRVKNLETSVKFYTDVLGFVPVYESINADAKFTIIYLVRGSLDNVPQDDEECKRWALSQPGVLELTHNHGTENDPDFSYHNGNSEPQGFGHLCISVPDVKKACERFESLNVTFQKRLSDGRMKHIAFIKDPDDYWIEILQPTPMSE